MRLLLFPLVLICVAGLFILSVPAAEPAGPASVARPSVSGALHVEGKDLVDAAGNPAVLRGVSTHGLSWYPDFVDEDLFRQVSEEWNCNLIRLAMYSDLYCGTEKEENLALMRKGINAAIAADQYVLADWHILSDSDPNINLEEAKAFFDLIAEEYAGVPNVLYEICNEPNGDTTWADVCAYAEQIIPVIRRHSPEAVIIVGTPDYDRALMAPLTEPLRFSNIMYTCHFYTATHYDVLLAELKQAVEEGLPVFITECGVSQHTGDGRTDFENAVVWFSYLRQENMSFAVWSLSDKPESSALVKAGVNLPKKLTDQDLTAAGMWVRELIRGEEPSRIPIPSESSGKTPVEYLRGLFQTAGAEGIAAVRTWPLLAAAAALAVAVSLVIGAAYHHLTRRKYRTYDDLFGSGAGGRSGL